MAAVGYAASSASVALTATTARTILGIKAGSAFGVQLNHFDLSFDGVTASASPIYVEVCYCTWGANSPGTNSTSITNGGIQVFGRVLASGTTAAHSWTTEPTTLTTIWDLWFDPNKGVLVYDWPLGQEPDSALAEGFAIRCTAPAGVNARARIKYERI